MGEVISLCEFRARGIPVGLDRFALASAEAAHMQKRLHEHTQWLRKSQDRAAKLASRLEDNLTLRGPNRGQPLTEANRKSIASSLTYVRKSIARREAWVLELRAKLAGVAAANRKRESEA